MHFAAIVKTIRKMAFTMAKMRMYLFVSPGCNILNSLNVIRLANDAINVPVPPILTPKSRAG